jgi:hypothetical protein
VKSLWVEPGSGVIGKVEWTPAAARALAAKEYKYLSPVVLIRRSDGKAVGLASAALTNTPAIVGTRAIVNSAGGADRGERRRLIMGAAHKWDCDPTIQRLIARESYVDAALQDRGLAVLSNSERPNLPTSADMNSDRQAAVDRAVAEFQANRSHLCKITSLDVWVNGCLCDAGHSLLTDAERGWLSGTLTRLSAHTDQQSAGSAGPAKLRAIDENSPRATAIRKLVKEWASMDGASRSMFHRENFVGYNLPEGEPELTPTERSEIAGLTEEDIANL